MKKVLLILWANIFLLFNSAYSQNFNLSEIDATNFPKLGASFSAYTPLGNPYTSFVKSDFIIEDNGYIVPEIDFDIMCTAKLPLSVVLVLDKSKSMDTLINGERPWDWVVEGAKSFINNIQLTDDSQISVIAFASEVRMVINFTNNRAEIIDSIMKIEKNWGIYGSTNFNKGFLNENVGAINLVKKAPFDHRRVIVFLTDGYHEIQTEPLNSPEIISQLRGSNIFLYAINLLSPQSKDLKNIAESSNGKFFETNTKEQLNNIYKTIADDASVKVQCHLYWKVPPVCDDAARYRTVNINFTKSFPPVSQKKNYIVPEQQIAQMQFTPEIVDFGDPPSENSSEKEVVLMPLNYDFTIKDFRISPPGSFEIIDWGDGKGVKPSGDVFIAKNSESTLKVRFNQGTPKKFRQATLILDAIPCTKEVLLVGGKQQINIDRPIDGKAFAGCDTISIVWSGVENWYDVNLYYSIDNGATWIPIASRVRGLKYNWISPNVYSKILIKAEVADMNFWEWAVSAGGTGLDSAKSVAIDNNGMYVYVCGTFNGTANFPQGNQIVSQGKQDFYLAKYDSEGSLIWIQSGGSIKGNDEANGVVVDPAGNVYIIGTTYKGVKFGSFSVGLEYDDSPYMFVAKYSSAGNYIKSTFLGATSIYDYFKATGLKLKYNIDLSSGSFPEILVQGRYMGKYNDEFNNFQLPSVNKWEKFSAKYDLNLNIKDLQYDFINDTTYSSNIAYDKDGRKYEVGQFKDTKKFDNLNIVSSGETDIYIAKNSKIPISMDIVEEVLIAKPKLTFNQSLLKFDDITVGDSIETLVTGILTNNEKIPFTITGFAFTGAFKDDYTLLDNIIGWKIEPGESIDLNFKFKPADLGARSSSFVVYGYCADFITIPIEANGVCGGISSVLYDFGDVNLGKSKADVVPCGFKNNSNVPVYISLQFSSAYDYKDFYVDSLSLPRINSRYYVLPDSCVDLYVTFTPKEFGARKHEIFFIVYNSKGEQCNKISLVFTGNCITSDLRVNGYNWNERRVKGVYKAKIAINNQSNVKDEITSITWSDPNNTSNDKIFKFENISLPYQIDANSNNEIEVTFFPEDEIYYTSELKFDFAIKPESLTAKLEGIGILPKMEYDFKCDTEVKVGEMAEVTLTLFNTSSSAELKVNEIELFNSPEYQWKSAGNVNPSNIVISKNDSENFVIEYRPVSGSNHVVNFRIWADNYDGTFTEEWNKTEFTRSCNSVSIEYPDTVNFANVLMCTDDLQTIKIKNTSNVAITLFLSQAQITGNEQSNFELIDKDDLIIYSGLEKDISFKFNPTKAKSLHNAMVTIPNSADLDINLALKGFGSTFVLSSEPAAVNKFPGEKFNLAVFSNLPVLESGEINKIKVNIIFNDTVVYPYKDSFKSKISKDASQNNYMNWSNPEISKGTITIIGEGKLTTPQKIELFSFDYLTLLNEQGSSEVKYEIDYGCYKELFNVAVVSVDSICANDGRIIVSSGIPFNLMSPNPNPVSNTFEVNYSIAFETYTKLYIYNMVGEIVKVVEDNVVKSGYFKQLINCNDLSNGMYLMKLQAGPYTNTQKIMLNK